MTAPAQAAPQVTDRDVDILAGAARGLSRRDLGHRMGLTEKHIQNRLRTLGRRFQLPRADQGAIINYAYQHGLLQHLEPEARTAVFLPDRQREVLKLLCYGLTNQEIGNRLFIAEFTVKTHVAALLKAIGARTRAHAVALEYQHHFTETNLQMTRFRAQFTRLVRFSGAATVHAWNGIVTPCRRALPVSDNPKAGTWVSCPTCRTCLGIDQAQTTTRSNA